MKRPLILMVAEEGPTRIELESRLNHCGFQVSARASKGEEALLLAEQLHPDLILLDARLGGTADALAVARQNQIRWHIPIVFLADAQEKDRLQQAVVVEIFGCIAKPLVDSEIQRVLEMALYKRQAEEALRYSERRYWELVNSAHDWIWEVDQNGIYTFCSPQIREILGYEPEEILGRSPFEFMPPEEARRVAKVFEEFSLRKEPFRALENSNRHKDGRIVILETNGTPLFDENGQFQGYRGMDRDITSRKAMESRVRESELRQKALLDNISDPAWFTDTEGRFLAVNEAWCRVFGLRSDQVIGKPSSELLPPSLAARFLEEDRQMMRTGKPLRQEEELRTKEGNIVWFETIKCPLLDNQGAMIGVTGLARDITERRKTELALQESERKYRELVENANNIILRWTPDGRIRFLNEYGQEFFGYSGAEICGLHVLDTIVPKEDSTGRSLTALMEDICANPQKFSNNINENIRRNGERVWVSWTNKVVLDEKGQVQEILSIGSDITERKRAEEELFRSQQRLNLALKSAHMGVFEWNLADNIRILDENLHQLMGITREQFSGNPEDFLRLIQAEDRDRVRGTLANAVEQGDSYEIDFRVVWPNGEARRIAERGQVVRDAQGRAVRLIGVCWDVTGEKMMEEQLRHAQKMEAVGQLAGGMAHDFNNILTGIMMNTYLLKAKASLTREDLGLIAEVEQASKRAANLTRQLLLFSRRQAMEFQVVDLNHVMDNLLKMLIRLLGENITVVFEPAGAPMLIEADPGMMEQVATNLCVNARDAMPQGGRIVIQTSVVQIDAKEARTRQEGRPGQFVCLSVSDTGCGMDPVTIKRIFEPFFTTKAVGVGTGLGLAPAWGWQPSMGSLSSMAAGWRSRVS